MFGSRKVKLDEALIERAKRHADLAGYSSVEEFIAHVLEKALTDIEQSASEEEMKRRLKGLGYLS